MSKATLAVKTYSPEQIEELKLLGVKDSGKSAYTARHIRRLCEQKKLQAKDAGTGTQHFWKISELAIKKFLKA